MKIIILIILENNDVDVIAYVQKLYIKINMVCKT